MLVNLDGLYIEKCYKYIKIKRSFIELSKDVDGILIMVNLRWMGNDDRIFFFVFNDEIVRIGIRRFCVR